MARIQIGDMLWYERDREFAAACFLNGERVGEIVCTSPNHYHVDLFGESINGLPSEHGARRLAEVLMMNQKRGHIDRETARRLIRGMFGDSIGWLSSKAA